ncbi:hypothetical protein AB0E56_03245 [Microbacterium sp. NPDC028030]|uniref:hypothetical protein n=1 Tax=Microbacterium sp. NPDC028030 TaxID=3155124 RepID=UPI0033D725F7
MSKTINPISFKEARQQGRVAPASMDTGPLYRCVNHAGETRDGGFCIEYEVRATAHTIEVGKGYDPIGQSEEIILSHGGSSVIIPREFAGAIAEAMSQLGGRHMDNSPFIIR